MQRLQFVAKGGLARMPPIEVPIQKRLAKDEYTDRPKRKPLRLHSDKRESNDSIECSNGALPERSQH
jgi:hypothetical protein